MAPPEQPGPSPLSCLRPVMWSRLTDRDIHLSFTRYLSTHFPKLHYCPFSSTQFQYGTVWPCGFAGKYLVPFWSRFLSRLKPLILNMMSSSFPPLIDHSVIATSITCNTNKTLAFLNTRTFSGFLRIFKMVRPDGCH